MVFRIKDYFIKKALLFVFKEFETDPLFKKTSAQFDSGGGGGKFLCNLLTRDDTCQLLLDSNAIQVS